MGNIKKLDPEINPETVFDGRGGIFTFYPVKGPIVEWSYIVTLKGTQRGHHFHPEFDEHVMFVEGEGVYFELHEDGSETPVPVTPGTSLYIPKGTPHTFIPIADCKMIALITKKWNECDTPIVSANEKTRNGNL